LKDFGFFEKDFFEDYILLLLLFYMVKYLSFHNSSFALRYFLNQSDGALPSVLKPSTIGRVFQIPAGYHKGGKQRGGLIHVVCYHFAGMSHTTTCPVLCRI